MRSNREYIYSVEVLYMSTTNLDIRTDKDIKEQREEAFDELVMNKTTAEAIEEGMIMMSDPSNPRYSSIEALKKALGV